MAAHDRTAVKWHGLPRGLLARRDVSRGAFIKMPPLSVHGGLAVRRRVFKVWEACLDDVEAKNKETDKEKKEADFAVACAEPTLALKACVEKYPDYFGEMFGAGEAPPAAPAP